MLEGLVWLVENMVLLFGHLSGRACFPKPLTAEREQLLIERSSAGDEDAAEELIRHNLRLVAHIAKKYHKAGVDMDDLVSVGAIGLIKAVRTFRPEAGKLTTYASRCIENEIRMQLRAGKKHQSNVSLSEPIGADKEGNQIMLIDLLGTDENAVPDEVSTRIESKKALTLLDQVLTGREKQVIDLRYGVTDGQPWPQREVAAKLGISRSYVSRIEKKALSKLKEAMERT